MRTLYVMILTLALSTELFGQTIYVSPSGSDTNPGSITQPLQTISKAMSIAVAGDTIFLRGGTYSISSTLGASKSGTPGSYICLWAYPGETPVLDFSGESYSSSSRGIELKRDYWYLKGLVIENAGDNGIFISGNYNIVENCIVSNCKDTGIQISSGGGYNYIHNCDAFGNNDPATQGQNADGIDAKLVAGPGNVIRGCRVYDNADDGYDCYGTGYPVVFDSCWAFHNGYNLWGISGFTGNGNGFKLGGADSIGLHVVTNCVSFDNVVKGFDQNNNAGGITLYNCTSYRNGTYNFSFPSVPKVGEDTLKNDLSFDGGWNTSAGAGGDARLNTGVVLDSNSWTSHVVTAADFISLDTSLARLPREPDGSLPSTQLFRLSPSSGLVDAGVNVGITFSGSAPDIGAFESGLGSTYYATNGTGGGPWSSTSTWKNGLIPADTTDVIISAGDSVYVNSGSGSVCRNLLMQSGSKLNLSDPLTVNGTFSAQSASYFYNSYPGVPSFPHAAGFYINPESFYVQTSSAGNIIGSSGYDSTFGNVIVLKGGATAGANLTIEGDLTIETGSASGTFSGANTRSLSHIVRGNVNIINGQLSAVDSNGTNSVEGVWNVDGDVFVEGGKIGPLSNTATNGNRTGIFNIGGNLNVAAGSTLQAGSSGSSTLDSETGIINLAGNFTLDKYAVLASNSPGVFCLNFTGSGPQSITLGRSFKISTAAVNPAVIDTIYSGSSVTIVSDSMAWSGGADGSFVVNGVLAMAPYDTINGNQSFVLNDAATLAISNAAGMSPDAEIQVSGTRSFSKNANYVFNGTVPQITGSELPDSVNNLTINNLVGVSLTNSVFARSRLSLLNGHFITGTKDIVAGSVTGGSTTTYVQTDTSGGSLSIGGVGSTPVLFPVGTSLGYSPVWITNNSSPDQFKVAAAADSSATAFTGGDGGRVKVKWDISQSNATDCSLKFGWIGSEENAAFAANRSVDARIFLLTSADSDAGSGDYTFQLTTQPYTVSRGNITALGVFGVGIFGRSTGVDQYPEAPRVFALDQNYPNPFNPTTEIGFTVSERAFTTLRIFNAIGQNVATLFSSTAEPGRRYSARFDGNGRPSGLYIVVLRSGSNRQVRKMMLVK